MSEEKSENFKYNFLSRKSFVGPILPAVKTSNFKEDQSNLSFIQELQQRMFRVEEMKDVLTDNEAIESTNNLDAKKKTKKSDKRQGSVGKKFNKQPSQVSITHRQTLKSSFNKIGEKSSTKNSKRNDKSNLEILDKNMKGSCASVKNKKSDKSVRLKDDLDFIDTKGKFSVYKEQNFNNSSTIDYSNNTHSKASIIFINGNHNSTSKTSSNNLVFMTNVVQGNENKNNNSFKTNKILREETLEDYSDISSENKNKNDQIEQSELMMDQKSILKKQSQKQVIASSILGEETKNNGNYVTFLSDFESQKDFLKELPMIHNNNPNSNNTINVINKRTSTPETLFSNSSFLKEKNYNVLVYGDKNNHIGVERRPGALVGNEEASRFIESIEKKSKMMSNYRYNLIPNMKLEKVIKNKNSPLYDVYSKCTKELRYGEQVDRVLSVEKNNELMTKKKEKEKLLHDLDLAQNRLMIEDLKKSHHYLLNDQVKEDKDGKVFLYDEFGHGKFVNKNKIFDLKRINKLGKMKKQDEVSRISDNFAYLNRQFLMEKFNYNYHKDEDFIFAEELKRNFLNQKETLKKDKLKILSKANHTRVQEIIKNTVKEKDVLLNRIDTSIVKIEKMKIQNTEIDRNFPIDYDKKKRKKRHIMGKSVSLMSVHNPGSYLSLLN